MEVTIDWFNRSVILAVDNEYIDDETVIYKQPVGTAA